MYNTYDNNIFYDIIFFILCQAAMQRHCSLLFFSYYFVCFILCQAVFFFCLFSPLFLIICFIPCQAAMQRYFSILFFFSYIICFILCQAARSSTN